MSLLKMNKLNYLLKSCPPPGGIMTSAFLKLHGISPQLTKKYCDAGWISKISPGAYTKLNEKASWPGALFALQSENVHIGGLSALELAGFAHNIPLGEKTISLFNLTKETFSLPKWFHIACSEIKLNYVSKRLFSVHPKLEMIEIDGFKLKKASSELAALEVLSLVPQKISFEHASALIEGLQLLRPKLIQSLLESCTSFKVKRLFLYLAEKSALACFGQLNLDKIHIGKGKQVIENGGLYIPAYKISVPKLNFPDVPDV